MKKNLYIDITNLYITRSMTGIQRVVRSLTPYFIKSSDFSVNVLFYDESRGVYCVFDNEDVLGLLDGSLGIDVSLNPTRDMNVSEIKAPDIFFDIDSAWHVPHKRDGLYKEFKNNGATIVSYVYDLVPIKLPQHAHTDTIENFSIFINAVYEYADLVLTDSRSTELDFLDFKDRLNVKRHIPTLVTKLGADFESPGDVKEKVSRPIKKILNKKYLLFVGTLEPRKNQALLLEAYGRLSQNYKDLHLVYVGKAGWNNDSFIERLGALAEADTRIHWLTGINNTELESLYKKAFLGVYISHYEGFGLPIVESLVNGTPIIASSNSSMYEAGLDFADYLSYGTAGELESIIDTYLRNADLHQAKQRYIKEGFKPLRWREVYNTINLALINSFVSTDNIIPGAAKKLQHVMISIRPDDVERCIRQTDLHSKVIKEYIVITRHDLIRSIESIKSKNPIRALDERRLLGSDRFKEFINSPHQRKNWMLRSLIPFIKDIDPEFIMLDDDNLPLVSVTLDHFVQQESYMAYYYNDLLRWHKHTSSYDSGQHDTRRVLIDRNLETLSYSAHKPQILNKRIMAEVVEFFGNENRQIDEWSAYFNYAITRYPLLFRKLKYTTLNWPAHPNDWRVEVSPLEYTHENYYAHLYQEEGLFSGLSASSRTSTKVRRKQEEERPYAATSQLQPAVQAKITEYDLVHGSAIFTHNKEMVVISSIPFIFAAIPDTHRAYRLNFKILNPRPGCTYKIVAQNNGGADTSAPLVVESQDEGEGYQEGIVELPIHIAHKGKFQINFTVVTEEYEMQPIAQRYDAILLGVDSAEVDLEEVIKEGDYVD